MSIINTNIPLIKDIAWYLSLASAENRLDISGEYQWATPKDSRFDEVRSRSMSIFSSGNSIKDPTIKQFVQSVNPSVYLNDPWIVDKLQEQFPLWISQGKYYTLNNLDLFKYCGFSAGSQEAFTNFYLTNRKKRFRVFKGEYWWHMNVWTTLGINWAYIEDDTIRYGDVCICSCPFALTGDTHEQFAWLVDQCNNNSVELLVDFIYLPNSKDAVNLDLSADCIQSVTFSLSKTFPVQTAKIAVRLCKEKPADLMQISNDENICNRLSAGLGLEILDNFRVDYMVDKYLSKQHYWCSKLGLQPTKVVHFGVGEEYVSNTRWFSEYNVQNNRYNLSMLYENETLLAAANFI